MTLLQGDNADNKRFHLASSSDLWLGAQGSMHTCTLPCKYHNSHKHTNKTGKESSWSMLIYSNYEMRKTMLDTQTKLNHDTVEKGFHMEKCSAVRKHLSNAILVMD